MHPPLDGCSGLLRRIAATFARRSDSESPESPLGKHPGVQSTGPRAGHSFEPQVDEHRNSRRFHRVLLVPKTPAVPIPFDQANRRDQGKHRTSSRRLNEQ